MPTEEEISKQIEFVVTVLAKMGLDYHVLIHSDEDKEEYFTTIVKESVEQVKPWYLVSAENLDAKFGLLQQELVKTNKILIHLVNRLGNDFHVKYKEL